MKQIEHEITDEELLEVLCDETRYRVDREAGEIYSARTNKPLARWAPKRSESRYRKDHGDYVRIKIGNRRRNVSVSKAVWMVTRRAVPPPGCDIHHANECHDDNHWENLVCIFEYDHYLVHRLLSGSAPF